MATENKAQATPAKKEKPRYKRQGPIRVEAIAPFCIFSALVYFYFLLFFDGHLRRGMEYGATIGNGAEVNIASVHTSFWKATFQLNDMQFTDPARPERNRLQVGAIGFALHWDALLRAKFVIDLASITGIEVQTPRTSPGRVLPPEDEKNGLMSVMKEKLASTPIGDVAKLLQGFDPSKEIKDLGNLKSLARINELKAQLPKKEQEWTQALNSLPSDKDLDATKQKIAGLKIGGNPMEIQGQIKTLDEVVKGTQAQVDGVKKKGDTLVGDVGHFSSSVGQVDDLMKKDREEVESRLKLPKIDSKSLAKQMFGELLGSKMGQFEQYISMAKKYMPAKKDKKKGQVAARPSRGRGKNYEFGHVHGYPLFWMKRAVITSRAENTALGGNINGEILDVCSNAAMIGRPAVLRVHGDFPKRDIHGFVLQGLVDSAKEDLEVSMNASVTQFPVEGMPLSNSDQLKFGMTKAVGLATIDGGMKGDAIHFGMNSAFKNVVYEIVTPSKLLETVLKTSTASLPAVTMGAKVTGTFKDPVISIESNLAQALESGLSKQLQAQLAEARKKIDGMINEQVGKQKAELTHQMDQAKAKVTGQVDAAKKKAEAIQGEAQAKLNQAKNQLAGSAKQQGLDAVKKKLPFGR